MKSNRSQIQPDDMPGQKHQKKPPNEEYLNDYVAFKRILTLEELLDDTHQLPQQVAVWRNSFYHHFVYLGKQYENPKSIKLTMVHKINKKPLKLAGKI
jgi:hypothetical protein